MYVALRLMRQLEVDHMADAVDIEAASRDIGCHQHPRAAAAKPFQGSLAGILRLVAVDGVGRHSGRRDLLGHPIRTVLGAREHQHAGQLLVVQQFAQQIGLVRAVHEIHELAHRFHRAGRRRYLHALRLIQDLCGQTGDVGRHGRGKQHRVAAHRQPADDLLHIVDEAHVEHAVRFIENEVGDAAELDMALLQKIEQPARRRHHDVDAARQRGDLGTLRDATEDDRLAEAETGAVGAEIVVDLNRELARRRQHQCARTTRTGPFRVTGKLLQDGKRERGRLAGARLRDAEQIFAGEQMRDGLLLNRGRNGVAFGSQRTQNGLGQTEGGEAGRLQNGSFFWKAIGGPPCRQPGR